jgi:hypothetical protein
MVSRFTSRFVLVATLFVAACADQSQPTSPLGGDALLSQSQIPSNAPPACTEANDAINDMGASPPVANLFREGVAFFYTKGKPDQGWKKFADIVKHLSKNGVNEDEVALTVLLFQCAGVDVPENPEGNDDFFVGVITNPNQVHEFISSHEDFLGYFPAGFFTGPVIVLGTRQFDNTQVNDDDLQEYPLKVDITVAPPTNQNTSGITAIVKVCAYEDNDGQLEHDGVDTDDLVLYQQGEGVLPTPDTDPSTDLPCADTDALNPVIVGDFGYFGFVGKAFAVSMNVLRGAGDLAVSVLAPRPLFASSMFVDGGIGGEVADFSSLFAPVEDSGPCETCDFRRRNEKSAAPSPNGTGLKGPAAPPKVKK